MKRIIPLVALWLCAAPAFGQAVPDTVFIYETVIVFDTIVIRDTVRVKRSANVPARPKGIDANIFRQPTHENIFIRPAATFSENCIIYHENVIQKNVNDMNMNHKKSKKNLNLTSYLGAAILTAQSMTGMMAQIASPAAKDTLPHMPMQISVAYPMTSMGDKTVDYRYSLSINVFSGNVGAVRGIEFGGIYNQVAHDVRGIQFGGIKNKTRETSGLQFGGLLNTAETVAGAQFGGLLNVGKNVDGVQFAGIANFADTVRGAQFGGIANFCEDMNGVQLAGIGNVSREVSGVSLGGIFNHAGTLRRGVMAAGIVNVVDTVEAGIPVALVNIVRKGGYREWSIAFADYLNAGFSFKMGIRKIYTIFTLGVHFAGDNQWAGGIGIVNRTALGRRFDFQPEIIWYQYQPFGIKDYLYMNSNHLKLGLVWNASDRFGISVAPSVYSFYSEKDDFMFHGNRTFGAGISIGISFH